MFGVFFSGGGSSYGGLQRIFELRYPMGRFARRLGFKRYCGVQARRVLKYLRGGLSIGLAYLPGDKPA